MKHADSASSWNWEVDLRFQKLGSITHLGSGVILPGTGQVEHLFQCCPQEFKMADGGTGYGTTDTTTERSEENTKHERLSSVPLTDDNEAPLLEKTKNEEYEKEARKRWIIVISILACVIVIIVTIILVVELTKSSNSSSKTWPEKYIEIPSVESLKEFQTNLVTNVHRAGTPEQFTTALYVANQFEAWGYEVDIQNFTVTLTDYG